jgi:hypothetical protein
MSGPEASLSASAPVFHLAASHGVGGGAGGPYGAGGSARPDELTCVIETKAEFSGSLVTHWKLASRRYVVHVQSSLPCHHATTTLSHWDTIKVSTSLVIWEQRQLRACVSSLRSYSYLPSSSPSFCSAAGGVAGELLLLLPPLLLAAPPMAESPSTTGTVFSYDKPHSKGE